MSGPTRRVALKVVGATLGAGAFAYAGQPVAEWAGGLSLDEMLRRHYKELEPQDLAQILRRLEAENAKLKKLLAEAMLDNAMLKEITAKKW